MSESQIILGFDFGSRRIGIAVGQTLTGSATPLITVNNTQDETLWQQIGKLIKEWRPNQLVVGLPTYADGSDNAVTPKARRFGQQLQQRFQLPVQWVDERLSSSEAARRLGVKVKHKADIDKIAAQVIVESWISQQA